MSQTGVFSILMSSSITSNLADFKHLDYEHYVSTEQIHLLYLRWSKKYKEGALKPLKKKMYKLWLWPGWKPWWWLWRRPCLSKHDIKTWWRNDVENWFKDRQLVSNQNVVSWSHCQDTVFLKVTKFTNKITRNLNIF